MTTGPTREKPITPSHDHGYQFRGYHLDALRRPTFNYRYGDITVEDFFEDVPR